MDCKSHLGIDLHIHSNASDGTLSPSEIISMAVDLNLGAIAITDHDTIDGSKEAFTLDVPPSIKFLSGVEISANPPSDFPCSGSFHILGYSIDFDNSILNKTLNELQQARKNRNPQIIKRLNSLGFNISLGEVQNEAGDGQLGRPHIAQVMVKKGFANSFNEVFDKHLGKDKPAYVDKYRIDCAAAFELILGAGGVPVLAHPFLIKSKRGKTFEDLIVMLKEKGLKGIETYYPEHSPDITAHYKKIANRYNLLITGGTDFHGDLKPNIKMGSGKGNFFVPYGLYEKLIKITK